MLGFGGRAQVALEFLLKGKDAGAKAALGEIEGESKRAEGAIHRLGEAGHRAGQRIAAGMRAVRTVIRGITVVMAALAAPVGGGGLISKWALGATQAMETFRAKLVTATKDVAAAGRVMQWATEQAARTPFELPDVIDSVVRLMNYRLPVAEWFERVGNMAGAMGRNISDAVEAIADAVSGGGLERLKEFGISSSQLKEWGFIGEYTAEGIESLKRALAGLMDSRFAGGMAAMMETITGKISNFMDAVFRLRHAIGERLAPTFKAILDHATKLVDMLARSGMAQRFGDFLANGMLRAYNWLVKLTLGLKDSIPKWVHGVVEFARSFYAVIYELVWQWGVLDLKIARSFELAKIAAFDFVDAVVLRIAAIGHALADAIQGGGAATGARTVTAGGVPHFGAGRFPVGAGSGLFLGGLNIPDPEDVIPEWNRRFRPPEEVFAPLIDKIMGSGRVFGKALWEAFQKVITDPAGTLLKGIRQGVEKGIQDTQDAIGEAIREKITGPLRGGVASGLRGMLPGGGMLDDQRAAAVQRANELARAMDIRRGGFLLTGEKINRGFDQLLARFDKFWAQLWGPAMIEAGAGGAPASRTRITGPELAMMRARQKYGADIPSHFWGRVPGIDYAVPGMIGPVAGVFRITDRERGEFDNAAQGSFP